MNQNAESVMAKNEFVQTSFMSVIIWVSSVCFDFLRRRCHYDALKMKDKLCVSNQDFWTSEHSIDNSRIVTSVVVH